MTKNSVLVKRYKFKSKFVWFGERIIELNIEVFLYGSIRISPSFGNGEGGAWYVVMSISVYKAELRIMQLNMLRQNKCEK